MAAWWGIAVILVRVVERVRVNHGRPHGLDDAGYHAGGRAVRFDAVGREILKEQRGTESERGHRGLTRPAGAAPEIGDRPASGG